jgi:hypothetical protein
VREIDEKCVGRSFGFHTRWLRGQGVEWAEEGGETRAVCRISGFERGGERGEVCATVLTHFVPRFRDETGEGKRLGERLRERHGRNSMRSLSGWSGLVQAWLRVGKYSSSCVMLVACCVLCVCLRSQVENGPKVVMRDLLDDKNIWCVCAWSKPLTVIDPSPFA